MSTTIKIDTALARQTATVITGAHGDLEGTFKGVASAVTAAQATWDGNSRQKFDPAWDELQRALTGMLGTMQQIAIAIQREADAFEQADSSSSYAS